MTREPEQLLQEAGFSDDAIRRLNQSRAADVPDFVADVCAFVRRLTGAGLTEADARELTLTAYGAHVRFPWLMADEVATSLQMWRDAKLPSSTASLLARVLWAHDPANAKQAAQSVRDSYQSLLSGGKTSEEASQLILAEYSAKSDSKRSSDNAERRTMFDKDGQHNAERTAERMERERERLEREQEKLEREQEKLEREAERLEQLQERLQERQEQLEELQDELEEIEIDDVEDVREVLDVVTERIPGLMRGIQDSLYSADQMKKMGESIAAFFTSLVDAGMDKDQANAITMMHVSNMQRNMQPERHATIRRAAHHPPHHEPRPPKDPRPPRPTGFAHGFTVEDETGAEPEPQET